MAAEIALIFPSHHDWEVSVGSGEVSVKRSRHGHCVPVQKKNLHSVQYDVVEALRSL
jgi:hypothetical protein